MYYSYKDKFTIVPVMVGSLSTDKEKLYGHIFARYLADPKNLFIISSDFCHWGQRFRYTFYEKSWGEIHDSITTLDLKVIYLVYNFYLFGNIIYEIIKVKFNSLLQYN